MTVADVARVARGCLGTKWQHQGRLPGTGLDCAGLLVHVAQELGLPFVDRTDYGRMPDPVLMREALASSLQRIDEPEPGCIAYLWIEELTHPQHLAILLGETMIHALASYPRETVEHVFGGKWPDRVDSYWRWEGLTDG